MPKQPDLEKQWNTRAMELLGGRRIVRARYMTVEEAQTQGFFSRPVVLELDNGGFIFAMSDDEGNDGGALAVGEKDTLPVLR